MHSLFIPIMIFYLIILVSPTLASDAIIGRASVIDGDSIEIHGQAIRLFGIDAPESTQLCRNAQDKVWRCGQKAALALQEFLGQHIVHCAVTDIDRNNRPVARCGTATYDIGHWMVSRGFAVAYQRYSLVYTHTEQQAKENGIGIWSGDFIIPEACRRTLKPWTCLPE